MPWTSKKQAAWGHSPAGMKALGGKDAVSEWDSSTDFKNIPERVKKKKPKVNHNLREADFRRKLKK